MTFKRYCKLFVHVIITFIIIVSVPAIVAAALYSHLPESIIITLSILSGFGTVFAGLKYVEFAINRNWIK